MVQFTSFPKEWASAHPSLFEQKQAYLHPMCTKFSNIVRFYNASGHTDIRLEIPTCVPSKYSKQSLLSHGSSLGLGPPEFMARLQIPTLLHQVLKLNMLERTYGHSLYWIDSQEFFHSAVLLQSVLKRQNSELNSS